MAIARQPRVRISREDPDIFGQISGCYVRERCALQHSSETGSYGDPDLLKVNRRTLVGGLLWSFATDLRERSVDGSHDVGDGDLCGRSGETIATL